MMGLNQSLAHCPIFGDHRIVLHVVVLQAREEGVLPLWVRVRVAGEERILVVLADEILVGEHKHMLGFLVQSAADPGLLIVDGVAVSVTFFMCDALAGRRPVVVALF